MLTPGSRDEGNAVRVGQSWSVVFLIMAVWCPGPVYGSPAGSWAQDGYGATGSGFNPAETRLVPARLGQLKRQWTVTATGTQVCASQSAPVTAGGRLFLTGRESIGAYDAAMGRPLWKHAYADPKKSPLRATVKAGDNILDPFRLP